MAQLGDGDAGGRFEALSRMGVELDRAVELPGHALAVVPLLEDSDMYVRMVALETLGKLEAAALAQHAAAVVARLEDPDWGVRWPAVELLGKLDAAALAPHEQALDKAASYVEYDDDDEDDDVEDEDDGYRPDDGDDDVRAAAAELLAKLRARN